MTPPELLTLLGLTPLKLSSAAEALARQQADRLRCWPVDNRRDALWAIEHSGLFFGMACDPVLLAYDPDRTKTIEKLEIERRTQATLAAAGITDTATAIAWINSIIPSIDQDLAELQAMDDRHQRERQALFDRKANCHT
jgi:hypothetical protein